MNIIKQTMDTPWKAFSEALMYLFKPFVYIYAVLISGVRIGRGSKFYGFPSVLRHRGSIITIGKRFENRNWTFSNPLGINHSTILSTWKKGAVIKIGNDVGISGGSIVAADKIEIGDGTLIGANATIIDTDFHPLGAGRRYSTKDIKSKPVKIGKNVFIGMNSIILKGVNIPNNAIVPAGAVIRRWEK